VTKKEKLLRGLDMKSNYDKFVELLDQSVRYREDREVIKNLLDIIRREEYEKGRNASSGWEFETPCGIRLDLE
jgi:hypothetical protein